ncbi:MAG TPA: hypothetical protein GX687_06380 [Clostridia bacterium]|nr:hypothetical protein [Clostridia bacterium]
MAYVRITFSREMLRALLHNLKDLRSPAGEYIIENEISDTREIIRVINLISGDVFEQTIQKDVGSDTCQIYEFPLKIKEEKDDL